MQWRCTVAFLLLSERPTCNSLRRLGHSSVASKNTPYTEKCIVPGVGTTARTMAHALKSSASWSNPSRPSLQKHYHRAEQWIVVYSTAEVTCGEKTNLLTEKQSNYIPFGVVHRLANPGTIPLEIIEVQSGGYLGEGDIIRFEDTYGRTNNK